MAIFQDLEGDKAGGSLPYLQSPAHESAGPVGETRIRFSSGIKSLGLKLSGIAASGIKYREQQKRKEEKEHYEMLLPLDPQEKKRREHFERSNSLNVQKYRAGFLNRYAEAKKSFTGVDASVKFRSWMSGELEKLRLEPGDIDSIEDPLLALLVDHDVMPNAEQARKGGPIDKGHLTWEEATGHDKIRVIQGLHDDLLNWYEREEPKLMEVEQLAALERNSADATQLWNEFLLSTDKGDVSISVAYLDAYLDATSDLYKDNPRALSGELKKRLSVGVKSIAIGESESLSGELLTTGNSYLMYSDPESGEAVSTDYDSSWGEGLKAGRDGLAESVRGQILARLAGTFEELERLEGYAGNDGAVMKEYKEAMKVAKVQMTKEIIEAIGSISGYMAPLELPIHADISDESAQRGGAGISFGQHLVSDNLFMSALNTYLGASNANDIAGHRYGYNLAKFKNAAAQELSTALSPDPKSVRKDREENNE